MKTIDLLQIQNEAKELQNIQSIAYNQSLHIIAQKYGFKTYQAVLNKIKNDYIYDENEEIKEFKLNVFDNRKHIKSNFIKIKKLAEEYEKLTYDEKYDSDEEKREELLSKIEEEASKLSNSIAKMFFGNIQYKDTDNEKLFVEGCAYAAYSTSDYKTMYNDIDTRNADYFIELNIEDQSFGFGYRDYEVIEYDDMDYEGNYIIKKAREWLDWCEIPEIKLP